MAKLTLSRVLLTIGMAAGLWVIVLNYAVGDEVGSWYREYIGADGALNGSGKMRTPSGKAFLLWVSLSTLAMMGCYVVASVRLFTEWLAKGDAAVDRGVWVHYAVGTGVMVWMVISGCLRMLFP